MESAELGPDDDLDPTDKVPMLLDGPDVLDTPTRGSAIVSTPRPSTPSTRQTREKSAASPRRMALGTIAPPNDFTEAAPAWARRPATAPYAIRPAIKRARPAPLPVAVPAPVVAVPAPASVDVEIDVTLDLEPEPRAVTAAPGHDDWDELVAAIERQIAVAHDDEQIALYEQLAHVWEVRLGHERSAPDAAAATDGAAEDHQLLQKVVKLYGETKQWQKAIEAIERFVALETDSFCKGVYFHTAATVCRDELKSLDEAIDYYTRALDCFFAEPERLDEQRLPLALMSFEAIDSVLAHKHDWAALERAHRDMIERLAGNPRFETLRVRLLDELGELYQSRQRYEDAAEVFETAQQLDPNSELRSDGTDRAEILTKLWLQGGADQADKAVERHVRMLQHEPFKYDSYKALARIYWSTHQYDKRWCLCSALAFLKKADVGELHFYEQYKPRGLAKAKHAMSPESWAKLAHPDENRDLSALLGTCWEGVAAVNAHPHKDFGFRREDRRQLDGDPLMFSKLFLYVAKTLNVPVPDVYLMDDDKAVDIQLANAIENGELCPSFAVRPHLLQGKNEREVAFLSARRLAFMRPAYYLRMLLPTPTELELAVQSAIALVQPTLPVAPDVVMTVQQYAKRLRKHVPQWALEQLGAVVQRLPQTTSQIELAKWGAAVDTVSHRAGLVVCGDLEASARAIATEPVVNGGPGVRDKTKELVLFSISEQFFAVRAQMGLAIAD